VSERRLNWDGCLNVRDLGGHPTDDGGATRFRSIVRADSVASLSDDGWHAALEYGVSTVIDLRLQQERDADVPREVPIETLHIPAFTDWDEHVQAEIDALSDSAADAVGSTTAVYLDFLERFRANFAAGVAAVANAGDGAVVIHCHGGKDRTGLLAALLLRLAGVSIDDIAEDYSLSEVYLQPRHEEWFAQAANEEELQRLQRIAATPAEAMRRVLTEVERQHGSVAAYLEGGGATPEDLERARARLR
jgi:protein tyrosine/serine phosphatase